MRGFAVVVFLAASTGAALAQDQQLGARTKAMGGSYTAFEDDPVSVWLNPAGIATQPNSMAIAYQTYNTYPLHREKAPGSPTVTFSSEAETTFVDPAFIPSYFGFVFHVGTPESPMAVGVCYARPYHLNYSFDQIDDPTQAVFTPDSNVDQSFSRFRVAFAKDFRFRPAGTAGFFTHLSVGGGLDAGYERWEFKSAAEDVSDNATAYGGGAGVLVGVYDDRDWIRINFGVAYQSFMKWDFNIDPDVFPAFDMPQQVNVGFTFYLLSGSPLRVTLDLQWIDWSETADQPAFPGHEEFEDAVNYSLGVEYRVSLSEQLFLYPRAGYRRFDAPWADEDDLPMTSNYKLVLDTKGEAFNIITFGAGLSWTSEEGKVRSVEVAADVGGDTYNLAFGVNYEF